MNSPCCRHCTHNGPKTHLVPCLGGCDDPAPKDDTYLEWRVTGTPVDPSWPPYEFTFSQQHHPDAWTRMSALTTARGFRQSMGDVKVQRRTVTITAWEDL